MNLKILEFQAKLKQQDETIRFLENRLNENGRQLKEKDKMIDQLNDRDRAKTQYMVENEPNRQKNVMFSCQNDDDAYLLKRIKDI